MAHTVMVGDLEIDQDLVFERREWRVHRVAWSLLALLVLAGLLGLLGGEGPLSRRQVATTGTEKPAIVEYRRFARLEGPTDVVLHVPAPALQTAESEHAASNEIAVRISHSYADAVVVEMMTPRPRREIAGEEWVTYLFDAHASRDAILSLRFKPQRPGTLECLLGVSRAPAGMVGGEGTLRFTQLVYP